VAPGAGGRPASREPGVSIVYAVHFDCELPMPRLLWSEIEGGNARVGCGRRRSVGDRSTGALGGVAWLLASAVSDDGSMDGPMDGYLLARHAHSH
jgi:hypothetical protein